MVENIHPLTLSFDGVRGFSNERTNEEINEKKIAIT